MAKTKTTRKTQRASKASKPSTKAKTKAGTKASRATSTRKSPKKKTSTTAKRSRTAKGEEPVTIDRRRTAGRRQKEADTTASKPKTKGPAASKPKPKPIPKTPKPPLERREKVSRRRQIDPTTCERDYTDREVEFMNAFDEYKRKSGRMFPTCSEVLEVICSLGYVQLTPAEQAARQSPEDTFSIEGAEDSLEQEAESLVAELAV